MRVAARLERLERDAGVGARVCATCGFPTDGRRLPPGSCRGKAYDGSTVPPDLPERCPDCGAQLVITVEFDRGG